MTVLCTTPTQASTPIPIPIAARMSIPSPSPSPPLEAIPMSRSPASMGVSRTPTAIPMARSTTSTTTPRRVPIPPLMRREAAGIPMGGVPMERSTASLGTDYNPFYQRQVVVRPARVCVLPLAITVPTSALPSPPPSPIPSRRPMDENAPTPLAKRSALTPRAFPAFPAVWPELPAASRRRRRRGLSAPPPHLLLRIPDGAKTPRNATTPIRACGHTRHASVALAFPMPMAGE